MLALSEYAVVDSDASLLEALKALHRAQDMVKAGRQPHRAVLVRDNHGTIVGKLGHLAFLRALLPERRPWTHDNAMLEQAGVTKEMKETSTRILGMLSDDLVDVGSRAKTTRVIDVCVPTSAQIERHASLMDAIRVFLAHQTLSLLVTEKGRTVGILRLADVFDELAQAIRQEKDEPVQE
jgi:hypothetical protein